jgi:hypothetical protein
LARLVFNSLPGAWTLRRDIEDERAGSGSFVGSAQFTAQVDGSLLYEEHGELTLGAWRGPAWRRWIYDCEGDALVIRYPEAHAELHRLVFEKGPDGSLSARHTHICGHDRYNAIFRRFPDGALSLAYQVTGPAKSYRLQTALTRN